MGSALASGGSVMEPTGIGSIGHGGNFFQLLTEAAPVAPPSTKTLPRKPDTVTSMMLAFSLFLQIIPGSFYPSYPDWFLHLTFSVFS